MPKLPFKREKFRGKYYLVQRDYHGRFVSIVKWNQKNNIIKAKKNFKQSGSIRKDTEIEKLGSQQRGKNFAEVRVKGRSARKPAKFKYQVYVTISYNGITKTARCLQKQSNYPKSRAREEALENAVLLATERNNVYDDDLAEEIMQTSDFEIVEEGIIYYRRI